MLSIAQDDAVQMLQAGWTVRYFEAEDCIQWRSPDGCSGSDYLSESLDRPPIPAVQRAKKEGHIIHRPRGRVLSGE